MVERRSIFQAKQPGIAKNKSSVAEIWLNRRDKLCGNVQIAIEAAGGTLADIVSLRIYVVDYRREQADAIAGALREFFPREKCPVSTWIGVSSLAVPDFMIEIEATAVLE